MILSRGARLCEFIIRAARPRPGGVRMVGRGYLARRLGCSLRTVSRYLKELRHAGRLTVTPPRKVKGPKGWRTIGVNTFRMVCPPNPAPHVVHNRRSGRGDTGGAPLPNGSRAGGAHPHGGPPVETLIHPGAAAAALIATILAGDPG